MRQVRMVLTCDEGFVADTLRKIAAQIVENPYIDREGKPYDPDSDDCWPAGGGLRKDCEFNADALYAYYVVKDRERIWEYLESRGFSQGFHSKDEEWWTKGDTQIVFENYIDGAWGYVHTELYGRVKDWYETDHGCAFMEGK